MSREREPRKDWARLVERTRNDPGEWVIVGEYKNEYTIRERARQVRLYYGVETSIVGSTLLIRYTSSVMPSLHRNWDAPRQPRPHVWWEQVINKALTRRGEFIYAGTYASSGSANSAGHRAKKKWEHLELAYMLGSAEPRDLYVMIPKPRLEDSKEYLEGFLPKRGPLALPEEDAEPS